MTSKTSHVQCEALHRDFPYLNNLNADPRLLGFPAMLNPFVQHTSSSRGDMYSSHLAQAVVLDGSELPHIYTGFENDTGSYEFNNSSRDQDVDILEVIPKYKIISGASGISKTPYFTVVYLGVDDKKMGCFNIDRYHAGSAGFGYQNLWNNTGRVVPGTRINKDTVLVTSPSHKGAKYCQGTNLNVAYYNRQETIEDAMLISQSAADKMSSLLNDKVVINLRPDMRPINIYGNQYEQKFLPDINETVGPSGLLCAFRPMNTVTCAADVNPDSLSDVQHMQDIKYYVEPNSTIIDLDFYINKQSITKTASYQQLDKYQRSILEYWQSILDIYNKYKNLYHITPTFSTLVDKAIHRLLIMGQKVPGFNNRAGELEGVNGQTVEFIQVVVTYKASRLVQNGFKLSGREGSKGVICSILPDEQMPIDQNGFRADLVISPDSPIARMNLGQLYEQGINRISEFVRRRVALEFESSTSTAYETLLDWYHDVNPNYAMKTRQTHQTEAQRQSHVEWVIKNAIHLNIPPFLKTISLKNILIWKKKWNVEVTPVTHVIPDANGVLRSYTTKYPVAIGSRYIYCLCKIPHVTSTGAARVSHQGLAIKPGREAKNASPVSMTPVKFGEDEVRIALMDVDSSIVARLNNLYSNSPAGNNLLMETIITSPHPTRIVRFDISSEELMQKNATLGLFHHETSALGIETRNIATYDLPPQTLRNDIDVLETDGRRISDIDDLENDDNEVITPDTGAFDDDLVAVESQDLVDVPIPLDLDDPDLRDPDDADTLDPEEV